MGKKDTHVKHEGTIEKIEGTTVYVRIVQHSACAGCHVQSACTVADRSEKIIETKYYKHDLHIGECVWVIGNEAMSNEALRLAFIYPFLVLCAVLVIAYMFSRHEGIAGIAALTALLPYYLILYMMRRKIRRDLVFTVEKRN